MKLTVRRDTFTDLSAIGKLRMDGGILSDTLEDTDRHLEDNPKAKVQNQTAIPRGTYTAALRFSPHLQKWVLWLQDVPGFEWVYLHWGNKPEDTDGCILVGHGRAPNWISDSKDAFEELMQVVFKAIMADEAITVTVE